MRFNSIIQQAGGKEDSAQGVGVHTNKVEEALAVAKSYYSKLTS